MSVRDSERKIEWLCDGDLNSPLRKLYTIGDLQALRLWIDCMKGDVQACTDLWIPLPR